MKLKLFIISIICSLSMSLSAQKIHTKSSTFKTITDSVITESYNVLTAAWEISNRNITYSDPEWNVLHTIDFIREGDSDIWVPSVKRQYSYPYYSYFRWNQDSGLWKDSIKIEYLEDGTISYLWNQAEEAWNNYRKADDEYDSSGNYRGGTYYIWDKSANSWLKNARAQITFAGSTKIEYRDLWNPSTNQWDFSEKIEFFDDDDFNLELVDYYTWNQSDREWVLVKKDEYSFSDAVEFYGYISEIITSVVDEGDWKLFARRTAYLGRHELTGIELGEKSMLKVFPNPFNEYLRIENLSHSGLSKIDIIDISGKVVLQKEISGNISIPSYDMTPGLYFYKIHSEGKVYVGKVVKER